MARQRAARALPYSVGWSMIWRLRGWIFAGLISALAIVALGTPLAETIESESLYASEQHRIRLDHGLVALGQGFDLPVQRSDDVSLRIWVQQLPSHQPYLLVRAVAAERRFGPTVVDLPPADGAFHSIDLPWWRIAGASYLWVQMEGHGVMVATTADDRLAGGYLALNDAGRRSEDLALQVTSRVGGLNHYLPLYQFAEGKPGPLAWPRLVPLLLIAYVLVAGFVLLYGPWLVRLVVSGSEPVSQAVPVVPPTPESLRNRRMRSNHR